jgi:hypothetical protein
MRSAFGPSRHASLLSFTYLTQWHTLKAAFAECPLGLTTVHIALSGVLESR